MKISNGTARLRLWTDADERGRRDVQESLSADVEDGFVDHDIVGPSIRAVIRKFVRFHLWMTLKCRS